MTRLETVRVSRASADQRRGRAGRQAPGRCYRLWHPQDEAQQLPFAPPEILEADLAPLALELASAGVREATDLAWLDPPPAGALAQAKELLIELEALEPDGRITAHGRSLAQLPLHPRLAHLVVRGRELGLGASACDLAALLGERDPLRGAGSPPDADLRLRLELLAPAAATERGSHRGMVVDRATLARVRDEARALRRSVGVGPDRGDPADAGLLLALAYPDRIGQRRPGAAGRYLLRNGLGAAFGEGQALASSIHIVAAELDGRRPESRIYLAAPVELADLRRHFHAQIESVDETAWNDRAEAVEARRLERLGALVLAEARLADPDPDEVRQLLLEQVRRVGLERLPWGDAATRFRQRLAFLRRLDPTAGWPDVSSAGLLATLPDWLGPQLTGCRRWSDIDRLDLAAALRSLIPWPLQPKVDQSAPSHLQVPSGSRIAIEYVDPAAPVLPVRLQEVFGLTETPTVGDGRVPLTLHLLSPARRPVQVTRDLAGFWRTTYFEVRKDLKGRYPKHYWPDDPLQAEPTRRVRPRADRRGDRP